MDKHSLTEALKNVEWEMAEGFEEPADDIPHVTHAGVMRIAGITLQCYRLSNGQAVVDEQSMAKFMHWLAGDLQ